MIALLLSAIAKAVPLVLAATGGVISERAGVINFCLEGMMLSGAFTAVWVSHVTGKPYLGLLAAIAAGMAVGILHAAASLYLCANQVVSSIALNLLALGLTGSLLWHIFQAGTSPAVEPLPGAATGAFRWNILVGLAFVAPWLVWIFFKTTVTGLRLRAAGEGVNAARSAGVRVSLLRFSAVVASGAFAGAAGAYLSIGLLSSFTSRITGGRGYIAVAAVIFGKWHPLGATAAALLFGLFGAVSEQLAGRFGLPEEFFLALPYLLTLAALAGFVGRSRPPAALGTLHEEA